MLSTTTSARRAVVKRAMVNPCRVGGFPAVGAPRGRSWPSGVACASYGDERGRAASASRDRRVSPVVRVPAGKVDGHKHKPAKHQGLPGDMAVDDGEVGDLEDQREDKQDESNHSSIHNNSELRDLSPATSRRKHE